MNNSSFQFWYRWLLVVSLISAILGVFIAFFGNSLLFEFHNSKIADHFFDGMIPTETEQFKKFIYGPLGGTISGYFILQFFIVKYAFKKKELWSWKAIVAGLLIWFLIDSTISMMHGAYFNVYTINLGTLVVHAPPLILTYTYLRNPEKE